MPEPPEFQNFSPIGGQDGGNAMPPMNDEMDYGSEQFDTNFDAGVEASEEEDPKKYIQQLTGKLSQSLRSYNENLPKPDADLNKYVAGMIVKQAVNGLSPEDTNEILDKMKNDEAEDIDEPSDMPQQQQMDMTPEEMPQNGMGEGYVRRNNIKLDEIFNDVMQNNEKEEQQQNVGNIGYNKKPFTSPRFT